MGVKRISIPNHSTPNHSTRAMNAGGTKSNIGSAKNKSGGPVANGESAYSNGATVSTPCRFMGTAGMKRWVGPGVISDSLINMSRILDK